MPSTTGTHTFSYPTEGATGWFSTWETMAQAITDHLDNLDGTKIATIKDTNGNESLEFATTASAVNHFKMTNAATGNSPLLEAAGGDTNVSLKIRGKGSSKVLIGDADLAFPDADGTSGQYLKTDGAGTLSFATVTPGETNTCSNVGTGGVGVFKQKSTYDFEFKKINAGSSKITITDDTGNSEVDIDLGTVALTDLSNCSTSSLATGDLLVFNGTNFVNVAVGTDGQSLVADSGEAAGVAWSSSSGAMTLVASGTASASSSITLTGDLSSYTGLVLKANGVKLSTDANVQLTVTVSSVEQTGASDYSYANGILSSTQQSSSGATHILLNATSCGGGTNEYVSFTANIHSPVYTSAYTQVEGQIFYKTSAGSPERPCPFGGEYKATTAINGVVVKPSTGTFTTGEFALYGLT